MNKTYLRPRNTVKSVEKAKYEAFKKQCLRLTNLTALCVLNDKFDMSNEDMQTFQDTYELLIDSMWKGVDDLDKIERALVEECGIEFSNA